MRNSGRPSIRTSLCMFLNNARQACDIVRWTTARGGRRVAVTVPVNSDKVSANMDEKEKLHITNIQEGFSVCGKEGFRHDGILSFS